MANILEQYGKKLEQQKRRRLQQNEPTGILLGDNSR